MPLFHLLPCLRCGQSAVSVSLILGAERRETNDCLNCGAVHFLEIKRRLSGFDVCYHGIRLPRTVESLLVPIA